VTGRRERRHKELLEKLMEMRGFWKLKVEANKLQLQLLDCTL